MTIFLPTFILALCLWLSSCNGKGTDPIPDTTPPTVASTVPISDATDVSATTVVSVAFSEEMNSASLASGTFSIQPTAPGTVNVGSHTLNWSPSGSLATSQTYTATISTAAKDKAGNRLVNPYSWQFTTAKDQSPPAVISTRPVAGTQSAPLTSSISATFSEPMDPATLTAGAISVFPNVTGTVTIAERELALLPDSQLDSNLTYSVTIAATVSDTAGNAMGSPHTWQFSTFGDIQPPSVSLFSPSADYVANDSVLLRAIAGDNDGIDRVEFYAGGVLLDMATDFFSPYEYYWITDTLVLGSAHNVTAVAYDYAGNSTTSDPVTIHYLWRQLLFDIEDPLIHRDLAKVYVRASDSLLEFRVETHEPWNVYRTADSTGIDVGIFLDTDHNGSTGKDSVADNSIPINDIGAEYSIIVGNHGDSLHAYSPSGTPTDSGLVNYLTAPDSSNFFEVSIYHSRIGNASSFDVVVANFTLFKTSPEDPGVFKWDWAPDQGAGHVTYTVDRSFEESADPPAVPPLSRTLLPLVQPSPFD